MRSLVERWGIAANRFRWYVHRLRFAINLMGRLSARNAIYCDVDVLRSHRGELCIQLHANETTKSRRALASICRAWKKAKEAYIRAHSNAIELSIRYRANDTVCMCAHNFPAIHLDIDGIGSDGGLVHKRQCHKNSIIRTVRNFSSITLRPFVGAHVQCPIRFGLLPFPHEFRFDVFMCF